MQRPKPATEPTAQPDTALDQAALNAIRELDAGNVAGLLGQVIAIYLTASPALIEQLRQGLERNDASGVRMAAHTLKSSSANLGASRLAQLCSALERAARSDQLASSELPSADRVQREFDAVRRALEREMQQSAT